MNHGDAAPLEFVSLEANFKPAIFSHTLATFISSTTSRLRRGFMNSGLVLRVISTIYDMSRSAIIPSFLKAMLFLRALYPCDKDYPCDKEVIYLFASKQKDISVASIDTIL